MKKALACFRNCALNTFSVLRLQIAFVREKWGATLLDAVLHPTWRGIASMLAVLPVLLLLYVLLLIPFTPSIRDLRKVKLEAPAVVFSADGAELAVFKRANRDWVKLNAISPSVLDALIATEDRRFYQHHGIDFRRTVGAAINTFSGDRQGGSTLTQQLARNLYPEQIGRAPSLTRKLKEAITALKIEMVYTKNEILETYLNTVPFLYNAYGIEMAGRTYFDKSADELNVLESATLVGMLKGNSYYNPVLNPERSLQRRNTVLLQMERAGKLAPGTLAMLQKRPLRLDFERQTELPGAAAHLTQQLRRWLIEWADRNDYNIYADGLVVRTTINARLQHQANLAVARHTDRLQMLADAAWGVRSGGWGSNRAVVQAFLRETPQYKSLRDEGLDDAQAIKRLQGNAIFMQALRREKTRLQAGFLALDPRNGHVMAWVGSRGFREDQFDHVQQARRQPGSTFKPFVYGAAFEQGLHANDILVDSAVEIPLGGGAVWRPTDGGEPSGRVMTLREGLAYSKNTITAQVMQKVGPERVARLARALGVRQSKLELVPSLALGTSPVTLKEMVTAYSTIASEGQYREPIWVTRIEDRHGKLIEAFQDNEAESAMSSAAVLTLLEAMRGVINQGTGTAIRTRFGIWADVAGKTGTTQDNTDGWFILMHPQLVAGAWVGFNDNRVTMQDAWGPGARSALPIVGDFFQHSLRSRVIDPNVRFAGLPAPPAAPPPEPVTEQTVMPPEATGASDATPHPVQAPFQEQQTPAGVPPVQGNNQ